MNLLHTYFGQFPQAKMNPSPILKRLQLAKTRACSYPMDNMDFILHDLEKPEKIRRHADMCTGDLSGRYLEMLAMSAPHDSSDIDRMQQLFTRILKCQSKSGPFGVAYSYDTGTDQNGLVVGSAYKLFAGLLRYYILTADGRALVAAQQNAEYYFSNLNLIKDCLIKHKEARAFFIEQWVTEPMALLYAVTGDERCLMICRLVADALPEKIDYCHSHGLMTALRGLQLAALYTGDASFNEIPEKMLAQIAANSVWADGNIPEIFPMSDRNEGCSIADWVMLNLYSGMITGNNESYERAENAFYNAFALNQIVSGGFGSRYLNADRRGYRMGVLHEECWWCCLHTGANAIVEYAAHSVVIKDSKIKVNLIVPGTYKFFIDGSHITVDVTSEYPGKAATIITVSGAPEGMELDLRIPPVIKNSSVTYGKLPGNTRRYVLSGDMGYHIEETDSGCVLKYGPLVMAPLRYVSGVSDGYVDYSKTSAPEGYIPEFMPKDYPAIIPPSQKDKSGFLLYDQEPWPVWQCYEEGQLSPIAYGELSANIPLYFPDGKIRYARFYPELNSTTSLIGFDLPLVFDKG